MDFDVGINTVSGFVSRHSEKDRGNYGDFWEAGLLEGQQITAIDLLISNHTGVGGFFVGAANDNVDGFGLSSAQAYDNLSTDGRYSLDATLGAAYPFANTGRYYFSTATNIGSATGYSYE